MSKKANVDGKRRPASSALRTLDAWLDSNGFRRVALVVPLGTNQMQVSRIFAGTAYLTASQRQAIERFTDGAITAAMLEGNVAPPAQVEPPRPMTAEVREPAVAPAAPRPQTAEDAERIVDDLAAKAMPAAFKIILEQMVRGKSESERRRCAEILIEHLRGKAKQYEKREQLVQPVSDEALLRRLREIEANLIGKPLEEIP
jgi:hypothetical protein